MKILIERSFEIISVILNTFCLVRRIFLCKKYIFKSLINSTVTIKNLIKLKEQCIASANPFRSFDYSVLIGEVCVSISTCSTHRYNSCDTLFFLALLSKISFTSGLLQFFQCKGIYIRFRSPFFITKNISIFERIISILRNFTVQYFFLIFNV